MRPFTSTHRRSPPTWLLLGLLAAGTGCERTTLAPAATCREDAECPADQLCDAFLCVPRDSRACQSGAGGTALLQPVPHAVDFGLVASREATGQTVTLHNLGSCTLTVLGAALTQPAPGFSCGQCAGQFPKELFPGRTLELELGFTPTVAGTSRTELVVQSTDPQYPLLRIPVRADSQGTPRPLAAPSSLDFGYVAQGRQARQTVSLSNQGSGTAPLVVLGVALAPAGVSDFTLEATPGLPRTLVPYAVDRSAGWPVAVRFTPHSPAPQVAELLITTSHGVVRVPLAGTAATPPVAALSPLDLDLGDVTLGATAARPLTIVNQGGVPLTATLRWAAGTSSDLSTSPGTLPPVAPGDLVELQVSVTATRLGPTSGLLQLGTNDPLHPWLVVSVRANGVAGAASAVVKVDVTANPGSSGLFTDDVRKVEASLESPAGLVCDRRLPAPAAWGDSGTCTYLAFGAQANPERFVLVDARQDGTWRLRLTYARDCASLPTTLLVSLLGISLEALQAWLNGGTVVVPGQDLGQAIQDLCLSRQPSAVDVAVFVDGVQVGETTATVRTQGESVAVLELVRAGGVFTVRAP